MLEVIRGSQTDQLDRDELLNLIARFHQVQVDLGTGDGRYAARMARAHPDRLVIGVDAYRENLRPTSRPSRAPANALYVIANALELPAELDQAADRISILLPWGSLLAGLLGSEPGILEGLDRMARLTAELEIYLNVAALAEAGWELTAGAEQLRRMLPQAGFEPGEIEPLSVDELRRLPSSWARRLAAGPQPGSVRILAHRA
ncbi:MAG TPA: class I SAM-dependent methyltransferase [Thermomicrobiaceae bacterium]|nr:class I SAM-dependent methyltransferase [Thermomicrobiaceae bacterium]